MLLAASESAVTKKPRLRLMMRRSSSVRPFGSFHRAMSRFMLISCGIQWLAQVARYFSQAHLYLKGTSWLTSVWPLMMRLSAAFTRRAAGTATLGCGCVDAVAAGVCITACGACTRALAADDAAALCAAVDRGICAGAKAPSSSLRMAGCATDAEEDSEKRGTGASRCPDDPRGRFGCDEGLTSSSQVSIE